MQYFQKLIQKDLGFTHSLGETVPSNDRAEIWALHRGKAKDTGEPSLVLRFEPSKARNADRNQALAKTGLMRLKTLRHPDILRYLTSVEGSDGTIYIATEPATPLATILENNPSKIDRESILWGLFTVSRALGFMHTSGLIHGRLNPSTIFVTPTGDWKLAGLECVTPHASAASLAQYATTLQVPTYQSPEFSMGNWSSVASAAPSAVDSWALGCLMYEVHAGSLNSPDQLQNTSVFPKPLLSAYQRLLSSNPSARAPAGQLSTHPYFQNSKFIELNMFVENIALKGQLEREAFLSKLPVTMDRLPDGFCTYKILPMLSQSIEAGGTAGIAAFSCIIKMKDRLSATDFASNVVRKHALSWLSNQNLDRNLRVQLYTNLDLFTAHLDDNQINTVVFPSLCTAFQDMQAPALRDASVKSVLNVSARLTDKNLNSVLMSHFARLQVDPEPAIRTNTTVCLGKVAERLSATARNKVLAAAFIRSLKDPFPPARAAGLNGIVASKDMYSARDIAMRLLPATTPLLVDSAGDVRKLAFHVLTEFKQQLTKNHESMLQAEESAALKAGTQTVLAQNGERDGNKGIAPSTSLSSGWSLSTFTTMTAALLSKSDSTASISAPGSSATGISSEDFKAGRAPKVAPPPKPSTSMPPVSSSSTAAAADNVWGDSNLTAPVQGSRGNAGTSTSSFSMDGMNAFEEIAEEQNGGIEDDDDDGWGDMDIKSEKQQDDEDILVSMLGKPASKTQSLPAGISRASSGSSMGGGGNAEGGLWDLAPPQVSRPKPSGIGRGLGTTSGAVRPPIASRTGSRRGKTSGADDWESLLGGTGTTARRKPVGRGSRLK